MVSHHPEDVHSAPRTRTRDRTVKGTGDREKKGQGKKEERIGDTTAQRTNQGIGQRIRQRNKKEYIKQHGNILI